MFAIELYFTQTEQGLTKTYPDFAYTEDRSEQVA
jgi:hypothetical protein